MKEEAAGRPLRLWPGVVAVVIQWLAWMVLPVVAPGMGATAALTAVAAGGIVLLWWLFFSRAPWVERLGAVAVMALGLGVVFRASRVVNFGHAAIGLTAAYGELRCSPLKRSTSCRSSVIPLSAAIMSWYALVDLVELIVKGPDAASGDDKHGTDSAEEPPA